jgi:hypothetical protein
MNPNDLRPRTCYNAAGKHKRTFETRSAAKAHAKKYFDVYECRTCGMFHFSSKRNRLRPNDAR